MALTIVRKLMFLLVAVLCLVSLKAADAKAPSDAYNRVIKNVPCPGLKNGMDYIRLGDSDLVVSKVCMGTMTFGGPQTTVEEGVAQLNRAFDHYGVNFLDTAEMYPVPKSAETHGRTDETVKQFLKTRQRDEVIVATKVCGRSPNIDWLPGRTKGTELTRQQILDSVEASLQRLDTDYIDLLQFHWPDRWTGGAFGIRDFVGADYEAAPTPNPFEEQLAALQELVESGKVRYVGVSNETPYGVCTMASLAKAFPKLYPKIVSIQNSYSLVVRKDFEAGLSEACYHHKVGLLAYSPLAGGCLSGKYQGGQLPPGSRFTVFERFMERYTNSLNTEAVEAYCALAREHGLSPVQLALGWCYHREIVSSTIIGATNLEQLEENLKAFDVRLDDQVHDKIQAIYQRYTDPTKAR